MSAEPITITLPGPTVTRAVTWDAVRAYLRADGWTDCDKNVWEPPGPYVASTAVRASGDADDLSFAVRRVARLANVSPGEMLARIVDGAALPSTPEDMGAIMTACRNRGAEDMRERCANLIKRAAEVRNDGEAFGQRTGNDRLVSMSKAEAKALRHAEAEIRALPIPANDPAPAPLRVPGCVRREAEGAGHPGACREKV